MTTYFVKVMRRIGYVCAAFIILAALLVSAGRLSTPWLNEHLPDFEAWSTQLLQVPVKIGHVQISWDVYEPEIAFDHVLILDQKTNKPKFSIAQIRVNLNIIRSLAYWKPITQSIVVSGVHLTIRQPTSGRFLIDEIGELPVTDALTGSTAQSTEVLGWLFAQPNLVLEDVEINYHLPSGTQKSFTLEQLMLNNDGNKHQLIGDGVLNQDIPTYVKINLKWLGDITDIPHVSARLYLYMEGFSLPQWFKSFSWNNLQVKQGLGSAKVWVTYKEDQVQKIQSQFQFYDLQVESLITHKIEEISRLSGHVGWRREGQKQIYAGNDILIDLPNHLWPTTSFVVTDAPDATGERHIESINIGYLDLDDAKQIAFDSGLLPEKIQKLVSSFDPQGEIRNFHVNIPSGSNIDLTSFVFGSEFSGLSFNSWEKYPGLSNISGSVNWDGQQGTLGLNSNQCAIILNDLFSNPLEFDRLITQANLQKAIDGSLTLHVGSFQVINPDIQAHGGMVMTFPVKDSPNINLSSDFTIMNVANIQHILPMKTFDPELVTWLKTAFLRGQIVSGKAVLQGRLDDYPFDKAKGTFLVSGIIKDLDLKFAPDWPALQHMNGVLTFSANSMSTEINSAEILNVPLSLIRAEIPSLGGKEPEILNVHGFVHSDLANALKVIQQSPLQKTLGKDLSELHPSGPMQMNLAIVVPLIDPDATTVQGDMAVQNADLNLTAWKLSLNQVNGSLHFTDQDVDATNVQAKLFGEPALLSLTTEQGQGKTKYVKADLKGTMSITAIEKWLSLPLSQYAEGSTPFEAELDLAPSDQTSQPTQIYLKTDLKGITIRLPDPYGKKAEDASNFEIDVTLKPKQPMLVGLEYNKLVSGAMTYREANEGMEFVSGEIMLGGGEASVPSQPGLIVAAKFKKLDWSILQPYLTWANEQLTKHPTVVAQGKKQNVKPSIFRGVDVQADAANLFGLRFDGARFQANKSNNNWFLSIMSKQIVGQVTVPANFSSVQGKFQRFYIVSSKDAGNQQFIDPKTFPAISITANDLRYGDKSFGSIILNTSPTSNGMLIKQLQLNSRVANINATGSWLTSNKKYSSRLQGTLSTNKISEMLTQWGLNASALVGSDANANFDLSWPDAPYSPSFSNMSGNLSIKLGPGRIVNLGNETDTKLGLGRLLNLLSLSSIPRRLSLNFSDLFEKGYSFDSMAANFTLRNGDAFTNNFRFEGPVAEVGLSGRIGLRAKVYDMKISVTAHVTSSLPVIATIASGFNPIAGLATFVVDKVVSSQVSKVTTYDYRVTGPWDNPQWSQITNPNLRRQ